MSTKFIMLFIVKNKSVSIYQGCNFVEKIHACYVDSFINNFFIVWVWYTPNDEKGPDPTEEPTKQGENEIEEEKK